MPGKELGVGWVYWESETEHTRNSTIWDQCKCRPSIFPPEVMRPTSVNKPEDGAEYSNAVRYRPRDFPEDKHMRTIHWLMIALTDQSRGIVQCHHQIPLQVVGRKIVRFRGDFEDQSYQLHNTGRWFRSHLQHFWWVTTLACRVDWPSLTKCITVPVSAQYRTENSPTSSGENAYNVVIVLVPVYGHLGYTHGVAT